MRRRGIGAVWVALYIGSIFAANWAVETFGIVSVGFGLLAPAGVFFVGLAFTLRDLTQETLGKAAVIGAIVVGAGLSALVSADLALASGAAFLFSELADFGVYTPLREKNMLAAVVASNIVGLVLDSIIFLWLAFHSLQFLPGQIVGKAWTLIPAVAFVLYLRHKREAVA